VTVYVYSILPLVFEEQCPGSGAVVLKNMISRIYDFIISLDALCCTCSLGPSRSSPMTVLPIGRTCFQIRGLTFLASLDHVSDKTYLH
jgi:hypothetical protein